MTETNKRQDLMATLRDALSTLEGTLGRTREGVDALGALQQREPTDVVGIEMFVDAATALLEAFRELESGILDVQTEVDALAAGMADDEDSRET